MLKIYWNVIPTGVVTQVYFCKCIYLHMIYQNVCANATYGICLFIIISDYSQTGYEKAIWKINQSKIIPSKTVRILISLNIAIIHFGQSSHNLFGNRSDNILWYMRECMIFFSKYDNLSAFERRPKDHILTLQIWYCIFYKDFISRLS